MSTTPKCTSWRGHKFEGRYSKGAALAMPKFRFEHASEVLIENMTDAHREVTYERDICVRCGATVEKGK